MAQYDGISDENRDVHALPAPPALPAQDAHVKDPNVKDAQTKDAYIEDDLRRPTVEAVDLPGAGGTLLIGPSASGKTALLVSFGRACHYRERGEARMQFVPEKLGEYDTARLMRRGPEFIFGRAKITEASDKVLIYPFTITVSGGPERLREVLRFRVTDGPGGAIFGEETHRTDYFNTMVERGLKSKNLIICADIVTPDLYRFELFFYEYLQALLYQAQNDRLHFDNVLFLLTKADLLVHGYDFGDRNDWNTTLDHQDLAEMISPVRQAKEVLGPVVLEMIHSALRDDARMAIGICSALGFNAETGGTFVDSNGNIRNENYAPDEMLKRWRPFGIRDAVYFLAGGGAYGTVELYTEEDTYIERREFAPELGGQQ